MSWHLSRPVHLAATALDGRCARPGRMEPHCQRHGSSDQYEPHQGQKGNRAGRTQSVLQAEAQSKNESCVIYSRFDASA